MTYFSPLSLFQKFGVNYQEIDEREMLKFKKRLLTELELSNDGTIETDFFILNKNDIIEVFENLSAKKLRFFEIIDNNPLLSDLLNNYRCKSLGNLKTLNEPIFESSEFVYFISPYFAEAISKTMLKAFEGFNFVELKYVQKLPKLYTAEFESEIFSDLNRAVNKFYYKLLAKTENLNQKGKINQEELLQNYCNSNIIQTINALPDLFNSRKDDFGLAYINFTVPIHNRGKSNLAGYMMKHYIVNLECGEHWKKDIKSRIAKHYPKAIDLDENGGNSEWRIFFFVIWVLFQLARTCS